MNIDENRLVEMIKKLSSSDKDILLESLVKDFGIYLSKDRKELYFSYDSDYPALVEKDNSKTLQIIQDLYEKIELENKLMNPTDFYYEVTLYADLKEYDIANQVDISYTTLQNRKALNHIFFLDMSEDDHESLMLNNSLVYQNKYIVRVRKQTIF